MCKTRELAIRSRMETTKTHGLVEDYSIEWQSSKLATPRVVVRGRRSMHPLVTKNYLTVLLDSFVPSGSIVVTNP